MNLGVNGAQTGDVLARLNPEPWWRVILALGGGILGGILVQQVVIGSITEAPVLLASFAGAFAGGAVLSGIAGRAFAGAGANQIAAQKSAA